MQEDQLHQTNRSQPSQFNDNEVAIVCLGLKFPFDKPCQKINQIEIDREWLYVSVSVLDEPQFDVKGWVGVDRNTTGHCAVAACTKTGKLIFLGKQAVLQLEHRGHEAALWELGARFQD